MQAVRHGEDRVLLLEDRGFRCLGFGELGALSLPYLAGRYGVRLEPATLADDLRGERYRRDHRSLLHRHGDQDILAVDEEVEADPHGEPEHADRVLDHRVGVGERQGAAFAQTVHLVAGELELLGKAPQTLCHLHLVEARQPAGTHPGDLLGGRSVAQSRPYRTGKRPNRPTALPTQECAAYMKVAPGIDEDFGKASPDRPTALRRRHCRRGRGGLFRARRPALRAAGRRTAPCCPGGRTRGRCPSHPKTPGGAPPLSPWRAPPSPGTRRPPTP